jgi:hypothetical protein
LPGSNTVFKVNGTCKVDGKVNINGFRNGRFGFDVCLALGHLADASIPAANSRHAARPEPSAAYL